MKKILKNNLLAKQLVNLSLRLHNLSYTIAGRFSHYLESDGLHPKHRLMKYHDWFVQHLHKDWDVLDVGCGNGALAYDLKAHCKSVFAIDINPENIKRAISQFSEQGITYICGDATQYHFDRDFDAIVLSNVLEHIENRIGFLKRLYANQNQDKPPILLLRVPMINRDWITLYKKEMGVEWRLDSTHFTEYTFEQIEDELNQADLNIESYSIQFGEFYGVVKKNQK